MNKPFYVMIKDLSAMELLKLLRDDVNDYIEMPRITNHDCILFESDNTSDNIFSYSHLGWHIEFELNGWDLLSFDEAKKVLCYD